MTDLLQLGLTPEEAWLLCAMYGGATGELLYADGQIELPKLEAGRTAVLRVQEETPQEVADSLCLKMDALLYAIRLPARSPR